MQKEPKKGKKVPFLPSIFPLSASAGRAALWGPRRRRLPHAGAGGPHAGSGAGRWARGGAGRRAEASSERRAREEEGGCCRWDIQEGMFSLRFPLRGAHPLALPIHQCAGPGIRAAGVPSADAARSTRRSARREAGEKEDAVCAISASLLGRRPLLLSPIAARGLPEERRGRGRAAAPAAPCKAACERREGEKSRAKGAMRRKTRLNVTQSLKKFLHLQRSSPSSSTL